MKPQRLVLGSSSDWRLRILERLGVPFEVIAPDIDEKAIRHPHPQTLALRVSMAKAEAVLAKVDGPVTIVAADTIVVFQGEVREKPRDEAEARAFLASYANNTVETVTAVAICDRSPGISDRWKSQIDRAFVRFGDIVPDIISAMIARGTALASSGALVTEDPDLATCVADIIGDYDSIMGLPFGVTTGILQDLGYCLP